jgi:hypothetical protein
MTDLIINYSKFTNKEIAKFDAEMYDKYINYWSNFQDFSQISDISYNELHCMIPGDVVTVDDGKFLLQKMTGGTLKSVLRKPDIIKRLLSMNKYKDFMIVHRLQTPTFYDLSIGEFYIYVKDYDNSCAPNWRYVKEYVGGTRYLNDTRHIWRDGDIYHHEYVLLFYNKTVMEMPNLQKVIMEIVKTANQHDISLQKSFKSCINNITNMPNFKPVILIPEICTDREADDLWIFVIYISMLILLIYFTMRI